MCGRENSHRAMLTHEQVIAYLEETLSPEEAAGVEAEFTADAAAANQLTELAQYDSALRTLLGGAAERARIEQSVLAAIHGKSLHETEARALRQTIKQMPDHRSSNPGGHEENNMNNPGKNPDDIKIADIKAEMAKQGVEILPETQGEGNVNNPGEYPDEITKATIKDQMAEQGVEILPQSQTKEDQVRKERAEEDGQKDASRKPTPGTESETQGKDNDYFNGMSQ